MHRDRDIDSDPLDGRNGCSVETNSVGTREEEVIQATNIAKQRAGIISDVDFMLQAVGLPTYSLLQRSCEEATKFVLSITKEPRTAQLYAPKQLEMMQPDGLHPDTCEHCKRTVAGTQSCCPFHYANTALTLLRPQPSETISQWAVRYVEAMLSE